MAEAKKERTIKIKIPFLPGASLEDQPDEVVSVNDRTWQIQRGAEVEVPECVYEVLRNRDLVLEEIMAFEAKHAKR